MQIAINSFAGVTYFTSSRVISPPFSFAEEEEKLLSENHQLGADGKMAPEPETIRVLN